jgi:hypothetical protein
LQRLDGESFLYTGITLAILKLVGTIAVSKEVLNKVAESRNFQGVLISALIACSVSIFCH